MSKILWILLLSISEVNMTSELKPCPFCGGNTKMKTITVDFDRYLERDNYFFRCDNCESESGWGETQKEAIVLWNTRQPAFEWKPIEELTKELGEVLLVDENNTYDIGYRRGNRVVVIVSRRDREPYEEDFRLDYFTHYALLTPPTI